MHDVWTRSRFAALLVLLVFRADRASALTNPINNGTITVKLVSVGSINPGTTGEPLDLTQPINDLENGTRLFVATHGGQIRLIKNGSLVSTPFASLNSALSLVGGSGSDERGLIGMAFHPDFDLS